MDEINIIMEGDRGIYSLSGNLTGTKNQFVATQINETTYCVLVKSIDGSVPVAGTECNLADLKAWLESH